MMESYPLAAARCSMSRTIDRSRHAYTWNHFGPSLTPATSSMERVESVESVYGSPWWAATRATASSPCECAMRVKPVGENTNGYCSRWPRSDAVVSIADTSRITRGLNSYRPKAALLLCSDVSSSAAPSM